MASSRTSRSKSCGTSEGLAASLDRLLNPKTQYPLYEKLWQKQKQAVDFVLGQEAAALFFEQRTGKTFITMGVLEQLPRENLAAVLVCLLNNKDSTWRDQTAEHLPWLNVTDSWEVFKKLPFPKLFLVHFDSAHKVAAKLRRARWLTFAIIDESHRIKARGSRQSRACARLAGIPKRLILTGTPMDKSEKDLWAQFRFLVPGLLHRKWEDFEDEFMEWRKIDLNRYPRGSPMWRQKLMLARMLKGRAKFNPRKRPKFVSLIKPYCMRMRKADVGIIEPVVIRRDVRLVGRNRRLYDEFNRDKVVRLGDGARVMAPLEVTSIMKKRQMTAGFVFDDEEELHILGNAKLREILELMEELPKPVVIFTVFEPELERVSSALINEGYAIETVSGATKKKRRPDIWRKFQKAQLDAVVVQIRTGGVGVDLWKSSHAIVASWTHSWIDFDQAKARMDHISKTKPNELHVLVAENTIDTDLYELVLEKGLSAEEVLKELKRKEKHHGKEGSRKAGQGNEVRRTRRQVRRQRPG